MADGWQGKYLKDKGERIKDKRRRILFVARVRASPGGALTF
jgi:hypothetical protein